MLIILSDLDVIIKNQFLLMTTRLPVFCIGIYTPMYGDFPLQRIMFKSRIRTVVSTILLSLVVFCLCTIRCFSENEPFFLALFLYSLCLYNIIIVYHIAKWNKKICIKPFIFLGTITLEIYLIHETVFGLLIADRIDLKMFFVSIVLAVAVSLLLSWLFHEINICITKCVNKSIK